MGPTPVEEYLDWLDRHRGLEDRAPIVVLYRAGTVATLGRFEEARDLVAAFRARGEELGHGFWAAASTQTAAGSKHSPATSRLPSGRSATAASCGRQRESGPISRPSRVG